MDRIIFHCDCNNFFASCECLDHPELRNVPMAVAGDPQDRHGVVVAKNELAKRAGVKTTDTVWVEKQNLPHFESVDCNPAMFHTIKGVRTTHHAIDSIKINNDKVTYNDTKPHFLLYLKERDY